MSKKDELDTRTRNQVKKVASQLLAAIKAELVKLDHWKEKRQTQAQVKTLIRNYLWDESTGLPETYEDNEILELAEVIYLHVYEQYETAANNIYAAQDEIAG